MLQILEIRQYFSGFPVRGRVRLLSAFKLPWANLSCLELAMLARPCLVVAAVVISLSSSAVRAVSNYRAGGWGCKSHSSRCSADSITFFSFILRRPSILCGCMVYA